ncbi:DUF6719 family protein [Bradyrhizobium sp. HKCCYLS1011]|uniref:DUF6719 family protein n=1 Tax=Bradyrhizobium sp. HKCCYLS1011 TaxID=3420733 RepID=UPI003EBCE215
MGVAFSSTARLSRSLSCLCVGLALVGFVVAPAQAQYIGREQDIADLRLGQRVLVDDGTCPAGQVKEVSGARMTSMGVERARKCVPRFGSKK